VTSGYHHGNLKTALVEVARDHLAERGPGGLSLREAARRVGVSHAAPYRHFRSKEELLAAVAETGFSDLASRIEGVCDALDGRAEEALLALSRVYLRFAFDHPALYRLMFGPQIRRFSRYEGLRRAADRAFEVVVRAVERGQSGGRLVDGPARRLAAFLWSTLHGLASLSAGGRLGVTHRAALDRLGETIAALSLRGISTDLDPGPSDVDASSPNRHPGG
jgi:AcrR family transcriptional regulator